MTVKSNPGHTVVEAKEEEEPSLISTMAAISTPLIFLILPLLASAVQEDRHGQSGGRALQWVGMKISAIDKQIHSTVYQEQGNHGGPHGSETW